MEFPVMPAAVPVHIPEKFFDRVWIESVAIVAPPGTQAISSVVTFRKYRVTEGGAMEFHDQVETASVDNVAAAASGDADLAEGMERIVRFIGRLGAAAGIIEAS